MRSVFFSGLKQVSGIFLISYSSPCSSSAICWYQHIIVLESVVQSKYQNPKLFSDFIFPGLAHICADSIHPPWSNATYMHSPLCITVIPLLYFLFASWILHVGFSLSVFLFLLQPSFLSFSKQFLSFLLHCSIYLWHSILTI